MSVAVGWTSTLAELGTDMSHWLTNAHLASWAKVCPGNNQSGGKSRTAHTGRGNRWLRHALIEAARAGVRTKDSYLGAQYRRLKGRRKDADNRAIVAVAHSILVIVYHLLRDGTMYQDLGGRLLPATRPRAGHQARCEHPQEAGLRGLIGEPVAA